MTNKINLFIIFLTFGFMFIFSISDFTNIKILSFFESVFKGVIVYSFFSYSVYYGLLFIPRVKNYIKENDLFAYGFDSNKKIINEVSKK